MKIAAWIAATLGALSFAGLIALANELGRYCEDINPYNSILEGDKPAAKDCSGCMGAAWGDCDRCREHKEQ